MAHLSVNGLDNLFLSMEEAAKLPDTVAESMLLAEARIVEEAQVFYGRGMGVYDTGDTLRSITHGKMKRDRDGWRMYVYPQGVNQHGERNAAVAFINEYGKRNQVPRPFIATANEAAATAAADAAAKIYDEFLKSKNL